MIFNHYGRCFVNMVRAPNEKPNVRHFGTETATDLQRSLCFPQKTTIASGAERDRNESGKGASANEVAKRNRFAAVRAAVAARAKDLMKISADQAAFAAQKDAPNGKTTMNAYLWKVCGEEYDQEHNG